MILEVAILDVKEGHQNQFKHDFKIAWLEDRRLHSKRSFT